MHACQGDFGHFFMQCFIYCYRSFAAVGVDPAVMGVGPAVAIPAAVKAAGLEVDDINLFEINEVSHYFNKNVGQFITLVHAKLESIMHIPIVTSETFPMHSYKHGLWANTF